MHIACIFADQCQNISVVLKNKAFEAQPQTQDAYRRSGWVNGKASWISEYQAIWYFPDNKEWSVGDLVNLGTWDRRISSSGDEWADKLPYEIPSDKFWYSDDGWKKPGANDIIIDCIDGKGNFFDSICSSQLCCNKFVQ